MFARDPTVIEDNVVLLGTTDRERLVQIDLCVKGSSGRFGNG